MRLNFFTSRLWQTGFFLLCLCGMHLTPYDANAMDSKSYGMLAININCPAPTTISCDVDPDPALTGQATAFTTCTISDDITVSYSDDLSQLTECSGTGLLIRTWNAVDLCGDVQICQQIISIEDVTSPAIMCPSTMLISCEQGTEPEDLGFPIVSDNCTEEENLTVTYIDNIDNLDGCNGTGTFTRLWMVTDECGNNAECTQTIIITDVTPPVISCPANITVNCSESIDPGVIGTATASDACTDVGDLQIDFTDNVQGLTGCQGTGTIVRTWSVFDACGNGAVCAQFITVVDETSPSISCPVDVVINCEESTDPQEIGTATAEDECGFANVTYSDDLSGLDGCQGTGFIVRTWKATDGCGNSSSCVQNIQLIDQTPPVIECPATITIDCSQPHTPNVTGQLVVSDNCTPTEELTVEYNDSPDVLNGCNGTGTIIRTWTATDACGNSSSCIQTINVQDQILPLLDCPADIVVNCSSSLLPEVTGQLDATDNCTASEDLIINYSDNTENAIGCNGTGMIVRTWSVTDACGNINTCEQLIMVTDDVQPDITCPGEITISCEDSSHPDQLGYATAEDDCTAQEEIVINYTDNENLNGCNGTGTIIRTWNAQDICGNSKSCIQIIHIVDQTAPSVTCPEDIFLSCTDGISPDEIGYPLTSDNCTATEDLEIHYNDDLSGLNGCMATGIIVRTWTVIDDCGNVSSCIQEITISDELAPSINCPTNANVSCEDDLSPASLGTATAQDNCTPSQMIIIDYSDNLDQLPGCNGSGILIRTWTATDVCGNSTSCIQTITVTDQQGPTVQCPASLTFSCGSDTSPEAIGYAVVSDNCTPYENIIFGYEDDESGLTGCNGTGNVLRTWTAYDACGNVSTCIQTITIIDNTPPALQCPENVVISCESSLDPSSTGEIIVSDNCTSFEDLVISYDDQLQGLAGCNGSGSIVRTWTVKDICGNVSTCVQEITVVDDTPPVINCAAATTVSCGEALNIENIGQPDVSDNCSSHDELTILHFDNATGLTGCNGSGTLIRNWVAFDGCGNMSSCEQLIYVVDNTPPAIQVPPSVTVNCELAYDMGVLGTAVAVDNCSDANDVNLFFQDIDDGLTGCNGTGDRLRMWIASDGCGNIDTAYQQITLLDTLAPLFYCPLDAVVLPDGNLYDFDALGEVQVLVDNCAPIEDVIISWEDDMENPENCDDEPIIKRTWSVSDQCGNVGTCVQRIRVSQYIAPNPSFPEDMVINCDEDVYDLSLTGEVEMTSNAADLLIDTITYKEIQIASVDNGFYHLREWKVMDYCKRISTDTQYIYIADNEAPLLELKPIEVSFMEQQEIIITTEDVVEYAEDNCSPELSFSIVPDVLVCDDFVTTTSQPITVTVTDIYGNETVLQTQAIIVDPQIEFTCPGNIFLNLGSGDCEAIASFNVEAIVPCGPAPTLMQTDGTGLSSGSYFPVGVTQLEFEATDAMGMTSTCSFSVEVLPYANENFLVCNDTVNVSLNEECIGEINADVILEGDSYGCYQRYVVSSPDPTVQIENGILLGQPHIGRYLDICVTDTMTGNYCCTVIKIEDKLAPIIECLDDTISCSVDASPMSIGLYPVPEGTAVVPLADGTFFVNGLDNCSTTILSYEDEEEFSMCEGDYIKIITRTWTATDPSGNTAQCVSTIYLERGELGEITFPGDIAIDCSSDCILPDGTTDPACTGAPQGDFCEQFFFAMTDKIIYGCGGTYAIRREWVLVDWCNSETIIEWEQIINVDDTTGPVIACQDTMFIPLDASSCTADINLAPPAVSDACMSDSITFTLQDEVHYFDQANGLFQIGELSIGSHTYTWVAEDACGNRSTCTFVITIVDDTPPVPYCDQHTIVAINNEDQFGVTLVAATTFDDGSFDACSEVTFRARRMTSCIDFDWTTDGVNHTPNGITNASDKGTRFEKYVPFSCCDVSADEPIMVQLEVTDASGNVNYCMVEIEVQDKIAPEIICPPDIFVSCSFWYDEDILDDLNDRTFGTVVDGFFQTEGDRQPIIINDPANPNQNQPYNWGIDGFASDNCNMDLSISIKIYDDCSGDQLPGNPPAGATRLIERRFKALDPSGKSSGCTQRIWVINYDPFYINSSNSMDPSDDVIWPADVEVDHCGKPDTIYPTILNSDCAQIGTSLKEQVFHFEQGSCMKILREWTIVDWCQYNPFSNEGIWKHTQVIKITDNASALFMDCPDQTVILCSDNDNVEDIQGDINNPTPCGAHVIFEHEIEDVCSEEVTFDVKIYLFNQPTPIVVLPPTDQSLENGLATLTFNTKTSPIFNIAQNGLPYNDPNNLADVHRILWSVVDACGNLATCSYEFRLEDCKKPTPVCINGLSSVVMPSNGELTIWAKDFNASSYDNCTPEGQLLYSFSGDSYVPSMIYTCDNVPAFGAQIPVEIYVWDHWGNNDYCSTSIVILDNEGVCGNGQGTISGTVKISDESEAVGNVKVSISNSVGFYNEQTTSSNGVYSFSSVPIGDDYEISFSRTDKPKNGVSSLDLVRIQQHLLGTSPMTNPYMMIAADINNSESVTAVDLIELRKLILGLNVTFPDNDSWRFVKKDYDFIDPYQPWPFAEIVMADIDSGMTLQHDFIGVKIGDLNATAVANANQIEIRSTAGEFALSVDEQSFEAGTRNVIPVMASDLVELIGMQFTLEMKNTRIESVEPGFLDIKPDNYALFGDRLTMSWVPQEALFIEKDEVLFYVTFYTESELSTSDLKLHSEITEAEAYDINEEIYDLVIEVREEMIESVPASGSALYQNRPNPFNDRTIIGFDLTEKSEVSLKIYDTKGQEVHSHTANYSAGYNEYQLRSSDLEAEGLYYYTIEIGNKERMTKKMVYHK